MFDFEVKIAQTKQEYRDMFKLRHEVFKVERGLADNKDGLDQDAYDESSDHLIVIDRTVDKVVGTYRFIRSSRVNAKVGFYAENFFDLTNIRKTFADFEVVELGRACIHKDYRTGTVINLLWNGVANYISKYDIKYLFGSVNIWTKDELEISRIFKLLKDKFYAPDEFRVRPKPKNKFSGLKKNIDVGNPRRILRSLPPLMRAYLKTGIMVCSEPAHDFKLDSLIIFVLLDVKRLPTPYKQHFF